MLIVVARSFVRSLVRSLVSTIRKGNKEKESVEQIETRYKYK